MLKNIAISAILALSLGVVGCGKSDQEKAEAAADRGNANIKKMNALAVKLMEEGVYLQTAANENVALTASKSQLSRKTQEERQALLPDLKKYAALAADTLAMGEKDNVKLVNKSAVQANLRICQALIKEIENPTTEVPAEHPTPENRADYI